MRNLKKLLSASVVPPLSPSDIVDDDGFFNTFWANRLYRACLQNGVTANQIRFSDAETRWSRPMLQAAIWLSYQGALSLDQISLPEKVVLPVLGDVAPPDDGVPLGTYPAPHCTPARGWGSVVATALISAAAGAFVWWASKRK